MTLEGLSKEYRAEAEKIKAQIAKQKEMLHGLPELSAKRSQINYNIVVLEDMLQDVLMIADGLEHYYDDSNRFDMSYYEEDV